MGPKFVYGADDATNCPDGSARITDSDGCEAASEYLKVKFNTTVVDDEFIPKGCVLEWPYQAVGNRADEFNGTAIFNKHSTGGHGEKGRAICRTVDATEDNQPGTMDNNDRPTGEQDKPKDEKDKP